MSSWNKCVFYKNTIKSSLSLLFNKLEAIEK